jgi:DNA-directed RNA polymerase specialized sigma subunit
MLSLEDYNIPTREIDRMIKWYIEVKHDCDYRIAELKKLKSERNRSLRYKAMINKLVKQVLDEGSEFMQLGDYDDRVRIITQRIGCDWKRGEQLYDLIFAKAKKKRISDRDQQIIALAATGMKKTEIAKKYGISRQMVYRIIENE